MKKEDFLEAIGDIDRDIIEESQRMRQRTKRRVHPAAVILPVAAAGIILALSAAAVIGNIRKGGSTAVNSAEETVDTSAFAESSVHGETTVILTLEGTAEEKMERQSSESDVSILHDEANAAAEKAAEAADAVWREHTAIEYLSSLTGMDEIPEEAVLYADAQWRIVRAENDKEQILVMIRYNEDAGHWERVCNLHSEKHTMSDKAMEITEAMEAFYAYYQDMTEKKWAAEVRKMTQFMTERGIQNYHSENEEGDSLMFSEEEMNLLREHMTVSYDPELSKRLVPQFMAYHLGGGTGYLKLTKPVLLFKVEFSDGGDPEEQRLITSYAGNQWNQYYILSAYNQFDTDQLYSMCPIYSTDDFFAPSRESWTTYDWFNGNTP